MNDLAPKAEILRADPSDSAASDSVDIAKSPFVIALALYLLLVLLRLPGNMSFYYKDEIAYVAAAERYASGDFRNAPNALWGPLISWLIAVPLALGATSIVAARSVMILVGVATLWCVQRLTKTLSLPAWMQFAFLLTLVPYLLYFTSAAADDLPLTAVLTLYFSIVFNPRYPEGRYAGAMCGLLGGFAYYAKGFALGFFLVHFTISSFLHWIAMREAGARKRIIRHFAAGMALFAALAAIWVAALYQKYGVATVGITGKYNYAIRGPEAKDRPALQIGFAAPPKSTTVSIWEDPAYYYDLPQARECCLKPWSPFDSRTAFKHQLLLFKLNLGRALMTFVSYSPFTLPVGFAALAFCLAPFWPTNRKAPPVLGWRQRLSFEAEEVRAALREKQRLLPTLMLFTILLYPIPYTLVFSDERFYWPALIVVIGLGLYLLRAFFQTYRTSKRGQLWTVGLFASSFLLFPAYRLSAGGSARAALASITGQISTTEFAGKKIASKE